MSGSESTVPKPGSVPLGMTPPKDEAKPPEDKKPEKKASNFERWWTVKGAEHSIVGRRNPKDIEPTKITMKNFVFDCDLDTTIGKQISKEFKNSGYAQSNLYIVCDKDESTPKGKAAAENFRQVIEYILEDEGRSRRGLDHVIAIFTREELEEYGIDSSNVRVSEVVNALYETKSFATPDAYKV